MQEQSNSKIQLFLVKSFDDFKNFLHLKKISIQRKKSLNYLKD